MNTFDDLLENKLEKLREIGINHAAAKRKLVLGKENSRYQF